jgi:hypothetical protein
MNALARAVNVGALGTDAAVAGTDPVHPRHPRSSTIEERTDERRGRLSLSRPAQSASTNAFSNISANCVSEILNAGTENRVYLGLSQSNAC